MGLIVGRWVELLTALLKKASVGTDGKDYWGNSKLLQLEGGLDLRGCLTDIIDYAGLFPPAALGPEDALNEYFDLRSAGPCQSFFRRFVFPMAPELRRRLLLRCLQDRKIFDGQVSALSDLPVPVSVLLPNSSSMAELGKNFKDLLESFSFSKLISDSGFGQGSPLVESVELALPELSTLSRSERSGFEKFLGDFCRSCPETSLYIEQNWKLLDKQCLELFGHLRENHPFLFLKIRTGGLTRESIPPAEVLAGLIEMTVRAQVPFKCTAGLHSALFETSKRFGFAMHGFVNILVAVAAALNNERFTDLVQVLTIADHEGMEREIVGGLGSAFAEKLVQARNHMHSFGCCSIKEPYESLLHHRFIMAEHA